MTNRKARAIPALLLAASLTAALAGCVYLPTMGPRVTEDREIDNVTAVVLKTDGDVVVTLGESASLSITARPSAMALLTSEVDDGVLTLSVNGPHLGLGEVDYALTLPLISAVSIDGSGDIYADFTGAEDITLSIDGSGDIEADGIDAKSVTSSIEGSGDIELIGSADEQTVTISGSGNFDGDDFKTLRAKVSISGSGDVEVFATETLDADISGSGEVRYTGGAEVSSNVSGSGSVLEDD